MTDSEGTNTNPELQILKEIGVEEIRELDKRLIGLIEKSMYETSATRREQNKYKNIAIGVALVIGALWGILIYQLNITMAEMKDTIKQQIVTQTDVKYLEKELMLLREEVSSMKNRGM